MAAEPALALASPVRPAGAASVDQSRAGWIVGLIVLVALAVRLLDLGGEPLWIDEAATWRFASVPLVDLFRAIAPHETNPPFFFALQHFVLRLGESEAVLRLLPLALGVATVLATIVVGTTAFGPLEGRLAGLLVALSAMHVAYSQEARAYTLVTLGAAVALLGLLRLLRAAGRDRGGAALYAVGTTIALLGHNTAVFLPACATLFAGIWWLRFDRRSLRLPLLWIVANLPPLLVLLAWWPVVLGQIGAANIAWIEQPSPSRALAMTLNVYGGLAVRTAPAHLLAWGGVLVALALVGLLRHRRVAAAWVLVGFAALVPLLTWLVGLVVQPIMIGRTLLWASLPFLVLVAAGLAALRGWTRWLALGAVAGPMLLHLAWYYDADRKQPVDRALALVAAESLPTDAIAAYPVRFHFPVGYYIHRQDVVLPSYAIAFGPADPDRHPLLVRSTPGVVLVGLPDLDDLVARHGRLWVIADDKIAAELAALRGAIDGRGLVVRREHELDPDVRVLLLAPP